jgi:hypothetical protein
MVFPEEFIWLENWHFKHRNGSKTALHGEIKVVKDASRVAVSEFATQGTVLDAVGLDR